MAKRSFNRPDGKGVYIHKEKASSAWQPLKYIRNEGIKQYDVAPGQTMNTATEIWLNNLYQINVSRFTVGNFINSGAFTRLGIMRLDQSAAHDFRDYQQIKNDVCGEDWEAIELYPSESRLVDPSNYFLLWAFPPNTLNIGMSERNVLNLKEANSPQRPFPAGKIGNKT